MGEREMVHAAMMAAQENKKKEQPEQKENREVQLEKLRGYFAGSVLRWTDKLLSIPDEKKHHKLPPRLERSAAMLPALLTTTLIACGGQYDIQECPPDVEEYFTETLNLLDQSREAIDAEMKACAPEMSVSADDMIDYALEATYMCSPNLDTPNIDAAGKAFLNEGFYAIDIGDEQFQMDLEQYNETKWTKDLSLPALRLIMSKSYFKGQEAVKYQRALACNTFILLHEIAHLKLDFKHPNKTTKLVHEVQAGDASWDDLEYIDEVYAWGSAAFYSGIDYANAVDDYLRSPVGSKQKPPEL